MIKKLSALTLAASVLASPAFAKISFSLDIEALTAANGTTQLSNSGLLVLVVDTARDGFAGPSAGNLASGDDMVVSTWDLSQIGPGTSDITLLTEGGVAWDAQWTKDDPLALYWFPSLSASNQSPGADEVYGVFADTAGVASGDSWTLPADGTLLHSLKLFTAAASKLVVAGDFPSSLGKAAFSVMNPPQSAAAPTAVVATPNGTKIDLTWSDGSSAGGGYIVQRSKAGMGEWMTIGFADDGATSYSDGMITPGFQYDYRLIAGNGVSSATNTLPDAIQAVRSLFVGVAVRSTVIANDPARHVYGGVVLAPGDGVGSATKKLLMQGIGRDTNDPTGAEGSTHLADPLINVYDQFVNDWTASNDDWLANDAAVVTEIDDTTAGGIGNVLKAEATNHDASILLSGAQAAAAKDKGYAFQVSPYFAPGSGTANSNYAGAPIDGDVVVAVYDADYDSSADTGGIRIAKLAARGMVSDTAFFGMIGGLDIRGDVPKQVLLMGWGPYFETHTAASGDNSVNGLAVKDPVLKLRLGGTIDVIAENDDWQSPAASSSAKAVVETDPAKILAAIENAGYAGFESHPKDAVMLVTLDPGTYTVELVSYDSNDAREAGLGFIEIDEVELEY